MSYDELHETRENQRVLERRLRAAIVMGGWTPESIVGALKESELPRPDGVYAPSVETVRRWLADGYGRDVGHWAVLSIAWACDVLTARLAERVASRPRGQPRLAQPSIPKHTN